MQDSKIKNFLVLEELLGGLESGACTLVEV
jgi:hypothetical protein